VVDGRGTLWVADAGNNRVLGYRAPFVDDAVADVVLGQKDDRTARCSLGPRGLCGPGGLAVDRDENLYVADILNNRILVFADPLRRDATADRVIGAANMRRNHCTDAAACMSEPNGTHPGIEVYGAALAIDGAGRLLVGNAGAIHVFPRPRQGVPRSRPLFHVDSQYSSPVGLAVDSSNRIYVTTRGGVERFLAGGAGPDLELGQPCTQSETTGLPLGFGAETLCAPSGVAVALSGEVFVSDAFAHRVVVFDLP